jgi:hypothetical protein
MNQPNTPTTLRVLVTFSKANGKPCAKRDASRIDEHLLNEAAELIHGCDYVINSTTWTEPKAVSGCVEVEFQIEVEAHEDETLTPAELARRVDDGIGCFCPEAFEVLCVNVDLA